MKVLFERESNELLKKWPCFASESSYGQFVVQIKPDVVHRGDKVKYNYIVPG